MDPELGVSWVVGMAEAPTLTADLDCADLADGLAKFHRMCGTYFGQGTVYRVLKVEAHAHERLVDAPGGGKVPVPVFSCSYEAMAVAGVNE